MNSFFGLVILASFIICVVSEVPEIGTNQPGYRKHPRRPPLPFPDVRRPPFRFPWPRQTAVLVSTTAATEQNVHVEPTGPSGTTFAPVVLYKRDCDPCMPGWGVKSMCNSTSNTVCRPCPLGTWAPQTPHYRPCVPCAKCGAGLFEEVTCVSTRDTKCDSCSNPNAKINDDYMKKCNWRQLARTLNPQELDYLDDTRFNVEVLDLQSKELAQFDENIDFGSNEDDFDRMLLSPPQNPELEEDITLDDPEIDLEQPKGQTSAPEDLSKEEEKKWVRAMDMRREADKEIDQFSRRLQADKEADETDSDENDDDDDVDQSPRRLLLHPLRPFAQMVPVPRLPTIDQKEDDISLSSDSPVENNFPPSYHSYPIDSLLHAGEGQRRKAIVLLVLTCAIVLSTIIFVVCYVREYCRRRSTVPYNRVLVVNLSPEEQEIVRQSATVLEQMEHPPKKYRSGGGYSAVVDLDAEAAMSVTENPLESYLNATDERYVAKESLIENEVLSDPKVHRRTEDA